jgi:hypothetical protein
MMRVLLLALMIALLPVRGWVGNAMAVDMATQQVAMTQQTAPDAEPSTEASAMPEDCPMFAQANEAETPVADGAHCNSCNTCELCLALASFTWPGLQPAGFTLHAEPLAGGNDFTSAERASGFKPPIS